MSMCSKDMKASRNNLAVLVQLFLIAVIHC